MLNRVRASLIVSGFAMAFLLGVGTVFAAASDSVEFLVDSKPTGATVFAEGRKVGTTPLRFPLTSDKARALLLVKKGYFDAHALLNPNQLVKPGDASGDRHLLITMSRSLMSSLALTTTPSGATVFLNGRRAGLTPYSKDKIAAGKCRIRIEIADHVPRDIEVTLLAGKAMQLHRNLRNKFVAFYQNKLEKEPHNILHYIDLAHYYTLRGEFDKSEKLLRGAMKVFKRPDTPWIKRKRLMNELYYTYIVFFDIPKEPGLKQIRAVCRDLLDEIGRRGINDPIYQKKYNKIMRKVHAYDAQHPR